MIWEPDETRIERERFATPRPDDLELPDSEIEDVDDDETTLAGTVF